LKIVELIAVDNGMDARLEVIGGSPYLTLEGFDKEPLISQNSGILCGTYNIKSQPLPVLDGICQ
jgi:hypothetical protein